METITSAPGYERVARWHDFWRSAHGVQFRAETDAGTPVQIALDFLLPEVVRIRMRPGTLGPPRNRLVVREDWEPTAWEVTSDSRLAHGIKARKSLGALRTG